MKPPKRVSVEALDMDWIFLNDNCRVVLRLLATEANNLVLVTKSIKTFVDLMWKYYQPVIIRRIFLPYLIYLFIVVQLCSRLVAPFILHKRRLGCMVPEEGVDTDDETGGRICPNEEDVCCGLSMYMNEADLTDEEYRSLKI